MKATAQQSNPIRQTEAEIRAQNTNWSLAHNNTVANRIWVSLPGEDISLSTFSASTVTGHESWGTFPNFIQITFCVERVNKQLVFRATGNYPMGYSNLVGTEDKLLKF